MVQSEQHVIYRLGREAKANLEEADGERLL